MTFALFNLQIVTKIHSVSSGITLKLAMRDNHSMTLRSSTFVFKVYFQSIYMWIKIILFQLQTCIVLHSSAFTELCVKQNQPDYISCKILTRKKLFTWI